MKKHNLIVLGLGVALLATSCKKNDVTTTAPEVNSDVQVTAPVTNWNTLTNWSKQAEDNYSVYSNKIQDKAITSAIAEGGMVLAFKKTGNTITALPAEEKNSDNSYFWYYQVAEGTIVFNADAYGSAAMPGAMHAFKYYIINSDQLKELENKGYSRSELMRLTYENAQALLKS